MLIFEQNIQMPLFEKLCAETMREKWGNSAYQVFRIFVYLFQWQGGQHSSANRPHQRLRCFHIWRCRHRRYDNLLCQRWTAYGNPQSRRREPGLTRLRKSVLAYISYRIRSVVRDLRLHTWYDSGVTLCLKWESTHLELIFRERIRSQLRSSNNAYRARSLTSNAHVSGRSAISDQHAVFQSLNSAVIS